MSVSLVRGIEITEDTEDSQRTQRKSFRRRDDKKVGARFVQGRRGRKNRGRGGKLLCLSRPRCSTHSTNEWICLPPLPLFFLPLLPS